MRFVIDGSQWRFDGLSAGEVIEALERLVERMDVARERGEVVAHGDELFTTPVLGNRTFWELSDPAASIVLPMELQQSLAAAFNMAARWADGDDYPEGDWRVSVDGGAPEENPEVAWAHHRVASKRPVACLGLFRSGVLATRRRDVMVDVHWVRTEREHIAFFRDAIDVEGDNAATLERLAPHAFPSLMFLPGVWRGIRDFNGGYDEVRPQLRRHLGVYDDHGRWAFTAPPPLETEEDTRPPGQGSPGQRLIERRFELRAVTVAPENPEVEADPLCKRVRERELAGVTLYCHWHGKLFPYTGRVHLHPPVPQSDNRVIVAIFHAHLRLPGDLR
jgi:hypothetical protein